jgi:hypothetical protein
LAIGVLSSGRRPTTADASLLRETFGDAVISARDLALALDSNHDLWADVSEESVRRASMVCFTTAWTG